MLDALAAFVPLALVAAAGIACGWTWHARRHPACPHWVERADDRYCRLCGARVVAIAPPDAPIINGGYDEQPA